MKTARSVVLLAAVLAFAATAARADWIPEDGHKMHYPQLPDPFGWDVKFDCESQPPQILADDWLCTDTGPVSDVHFWISMQGDMDDNQGPGVAPPFQIQNLHLSIHRDVPAGQDPNPDVFWSHPGELIKAWDLLPDMFTVRWWDRGDQGWLDPVEGVVNPVDHINIYQVNVPRIPDPIRQEEGTIYWLDLCVDATDAAGNPVDLGWKTSMAPVFNDAAVFLGPDGNWYPLHDPQTQDIPLDLAFVITPEPATLAFVGLGLAGIAAVRRRRCNHK